MDNTKELVLEYFATDREFASGKRLYGSLPNRSIAILNSLNRMSGTPAQLKKLHYELGKLAGLDQRGLGIVLQKPLQDKEKGVTITSKTNASDSSGERLVPVFEGGLIGMNQRKEFVKSKGIEVEGKKMPDYDKAIAEWENAQKAKAVVKSLPEKVKQGVKLRDRFPFLKQDDCPDVYKILVSDMISAYEKYTEAHGKLAEDSVVKAIEDVVVPYKENKLIWEELKYFQENGKSLGKHPVFEELARKEELQKKNGEELSKIKNNLKSNISKTKKKISDIPEGETVPEKLTQRLDKFEKELRYVTELLENKK